MIEVSEPSAGWRVDATLAVVLALVTFTLLIATLGDVGMTWDEGFTVEREERLGEWFARIAGKTTASSRAWSAVSSQLEPRDNYLTRAGSAARSPWSRESIQFYWPFAREEPHGHPPFYALLGVAGWAVSHNLLPPLESYRFGPAVLFALTVGVVYAVNARHYGRLAGVAAALGLVTLPRVFAHAHLASYDAPLLCLWFLAAVAFHRASESVRLGWAWTVLFGVTLGCAASTKLTGWFVPIPLAVWALAYRDLRALRTLILGGFVAALIIVAMNPLWWSTPIQGIRVFFESNLTRPQHTEIPTYFFGRVYLFSLPWYNTLVLTALVVPPATLVVALAGAFAIVVGRFRDRLGALYLLCWGFLMTLRALPGAPGHDVERQFLPAFVFLACLAAPGVSDLPRWMGRLVRPRIANALAVAAVVVTISAASWSTWRYHPLQLSYYNILIGGLSGASRAGLEPTYYWDAMTPDVLDWINRHTERGRTVITGVSIPTFEYLHHWGLLGPSPRAIVTKNPKWYIVQNRAGQLHYYDDQVPTYLMDHGRPAFVKTLEVAPDVPLIAIYPITQALLAPPPRGQSGHP